VIQIALRRDISERQFRNQFKGGISMSVAFIFDFEGSTKAQYDGVIAAMELDGKVAPGGLYHGAGSAPGGLRVIDVWEGDQPFEHFAQTKIGPLTAAQGMPEPSLQRMEAASQRVGSGSGAPATFAQVVTMEGIDEATFDELDAAVLGGGGLPEGCLFHVNGPVPGGWRVIDYWTSREARDTFMANQVQPAMEAAGAPQPEIEDLDLFATLIPAPAVAPV
jgi:hypothetical protein